MRPSCPLGRVAVARETMADLSTRGRRMPASPIRRLVPFADRARARGVHVHALNIGQPDIPTPQGIIDAYRAYEGPVLAYGPSQGNPDLRAAVAASYQKLGFEIDSEHVSVGFGGSEALRYAIDSVADPGDEIVVMEPCYANYLGFGMSSGVVMRPVTAQASDGFHLPPDEAFDAVIGPRTRAILVCSPGNPTGTVYTREEMQRIGRIAERHDLFIISDEVYRDFAYDGVEVTSALTLDNAAERVIVTDSVSKRFSACGARVGFAITRRADVGDAIMRMGFARLCPATVDQLAALAGYTDTPPEYFDEVRQEYTERRNLLVKGLNAIAGASSYLPEGAFYTVATFPVEDADAFAEWLLTDFSHDGQTVMMAPAEGFYATPNLGKNQARLAYVQSTSTLERSIEVLDRALEAYPLTRR